MVTHWTQTLRRLVTLVMHQDPSGPGVALEKSTIPEKSGFSGSFGPRQTLHGVSSKKKNPEKCLSAAAGQGLVRGLHRGWQGGEGGGGQERQGRQEGRGLPPAKGLYY